MSIIGIVCEFNPFHKGHKYLIDAVKGEGDTVVCVMSGNFVQRGEPAIYPKETRVKSALLNGVDIVLELPLLYATSSAESFAFNAVKILNAFGCDKLVFGTETATSTDLENAVDIISSADFDKRLINHLENGVSFPTARQLAFDEYETNFDISTPNNILAIEYVKAVKRLNSNMQICPVIRIGAGYNDENAVGGIASATYIRKLQYSGEDFSHYVPKNTVEIYKNSNYLSIDKYNIMALTLLRSKLNEDLSGVANMSEGLHNRITSAIKESVTLDEVYEKAKTKRFAHSRIRRAVLCTMLGITADDLKTDVPYCRLLGFNTNSSQLMGELAKKSKLPFVATYGDILELSEKAQRVFNLEARAGDFYSLIMQKSQACAQEMTFSPIKMQ